MPSQLKRGMTYAKKDAIIRRNAEKAQQAKAYNRQQSTHYELPKQDAAPEPQKHIEPSISIPSLGLFDTNNPVYDPVEEEFRRRMQRKKKRNVLNYRRIILVPFKQNLMFFFI